MASTRYHVRIEAPADAVWRVVGRPELLHLWFPGITSCTVEGNRRTIVTGSGLEMPEEIVTHDDLLRRFQYRITAPVFRHHLATIDVLDLDGACVVQYATDADPAVMALLIGGGTLGALRELQRQFHAGSGPAFDAVAPATSKEAVHG
jgi:uncharacterized protein YndB with AHSA1/START domain